jgi:hypothetical protein
MCKYVWTWQRTDRQTCPLIRQDTTRWLKFNSQICDLNLVLCPWRGLAPRQTDWLTDQPLFTKWLRQSSLQPWWWRQYGPLKHQQKANFYMVLVALLLNGPQKVGHIPDSLCTFYGEPEAVGLGECGWSVKLTTASLCLCLHWGQLKSTVIVIFMVIKTWIPYPKY